MTILDPEPRALLSAITEIVLIETGSRSACEHWQQIQLRNLINHVTQRSAFWRARIGGRKASDIDLASLPILTRQDCAHRSPRKVHCCGQRMGFRPKLMPHRGRRESRSISLFPNCNYNSFRNLAQFFLEGLDLSLNRTRVTNASTLVKDGISVEKEESWIGAMASLIKSGKNKNVEYFTLSREDGHKLVQELKKDDVGYLVGSPRIIAAISSSFDLNFLKAAKTSMWIPKGENVDPKLIEAFADLAIPVRANYSSEEVGMIGAECSKFSGYYHVATSNVIVEVVDRRFEIEG